MYQEGILLNRVPKSIRSQRKLLPIVIGWTPPYKNLQGAPTLGSKQTFCNLIPLSQKLEHIGWTPAPTYKNLQGAPALGSKQTFCKLIPLSQELEHIGWTPAPTYKNLKGAPALGSKQTINPPRIYISIIAVGRFYS